MKNELSINNNAVATQEIGGKQNKTAAWQRFMQLFTITVILSFLGWCAETVYAAFRVGRFVDRGFLSLPLCPIYGISLTLVYILIGTPFDGWFSRLMDKSKLSKGLRYTFDLLFYFAASIILPTLFELIVGSFFDRVLGVRLWNYSRFKYNIGGYVCLPFSLLWGVAIPVVMSTVWRWLFNAVKKINMRALTVCTIVFASLIVVDLGFNLVYILVKGCHFVWR